MLIYVSRLNISFLGIDGIFHLNSLKILINRNQCF